MLSLAHLNELSVVAVTFALSCSATSAYAETYSIEAIGHLPGNTFNYPHSMSDDGEVAVIQGSPNTGQSTYAVWTAADGVEPLALPGHFSTSALPVTKDGEIVAAVSCASDTECEAVLWTRSGGLISIGALLGVPYSDWYRANPSPGGHTFIGRACESAGDDQCRNFIWTPAGGVRYLATLPGKTTSAVWTISADGSTLVGRSCNRPPSSDFIECEGIRYDVASDAIVGLGVLPGYAQSEAIGISSDNQVVSLNCFTNVTYSPVQAAYWTSSEGLVGLETAPGDNISFTNQPVVGAGRTIIGESATDLNTNRHPVVWSAARGIEALPVINSRDRAYWLNQNGSIIVGDTFDSSFNGGVVWSAPDWEQTLLLRPGDNFGQAILVTDVALFGVSGLSDGSTFSQQSFRWTPTDGMQGLGQLPNASRSSVFDGTADGTVAVGLQANSSSTLIEAYVWSLSDGLTGLEFLNENHYVSAAWFVSEDGNVIMGESGDDFEAETVIWRRSGGTSGDADGDGIADSVDPAPATPSEAFSDGDGTTGVITDRAGLTVSIEDVASPEGVKVIVGAGSGQVTLNACGFTETVDAGSELVITCGSVSLEVIQGSAQIVLEGTVTLISVPAGVTAVVTDNGDGTVLVQNVGGAGAITVTAHGAPTTIAPGGAQSYTVMYPFLGFFSPVDNLPMLNTTKGGSAIPVKFSLSGNQGMNIFAAGFPKSQKISCSTSAPLDAIEETVTAGSSSLSYVVGADQYNYVWKTDKAWTGTCRQLILGLNDSTNHVANFKFR